MFNYKTLQPSPMFGKAIYQLSNSDTFTTNTPNELPNGMRFTLIEKFTAHKLEVMELLEKDGKRLRLMIRLLFIIGSSTNFSSWAKPEFMFWGYAPIEWHYNGLFYQD